MRYNEPIKPQGIGRNQLAFNTGNIPSTFSQGDDQERDPILDQSQDYSISTLAKAKASAEATATSLKQDIQNVCFEITGIGDMYVASGATGADILWNQGRVIVDSPLYFYNWYDRYIYVKKPGWYLVRANLFAPEVNAGGEWGLKIISNINLENSQFERYPTYMDYQHTAKHPYVNGMTFFNAPEQVFKSNSGGLPGFKLRITSSFNGFNFFSYNTYANLQVIRLSDLDYSTRQVYTFSPV
jgi:hypothetical protein